MEKNIENYLHFYVGCECVTPFGVMVLSYFEPKALKYKAWFNDSSEENKEILNKHGLKGKCFSLASIKPMLRPLSSMNEKEKREFRKIPYTLVYDGYGAKRLRANETMFLLSKGFDLFFLIESGLAVDKNSEV